MHKLQPLINRPVAERVLAERGVSALVLTDPTSIYQACGYWPQTVAMGQSGAAFAVVPARSDLPVTLIASQFIHYLHDMDAPEPGGPLDIVLYTAPHGLEGLAAQPIFLLPAPGGETDPLDHFSQAKTREVLGRRAALPDAATALREVLTGVEGTLAADSPMVAAIMGQGCPTCPAEPLLRRIRMIKSPLEIALMRRAAQRNAEAATAAISSMQAGSSYEDLRRAFFAETGRRGGVPLFMSTDSTTIRNRDGIIRDGRSFQIDAVSHYAGYHGDFGRTVFVGEPEPIIMRMVEAAQCANDAIAAALRPGLRYSDVRRIGQGAIARSGAEIAVACGAHSVGLFHTDEAYEGDSLHFRKADHLIEKDMVLSIDCPVLHLDAAGNVHLEDLWLITADGCEPLNERADPFIRI
ncbi:M24 family metallopeptidase [Novosphingobium sp.]|uniref:M24 family metallopeptidase n=1 Tax=Novosphingobium sp. TaxID=1874826 RepID=UPI00286E163B|nr:M24 family metallopeptidase [Novosphingobium sp.]